ncbi:MAG TPA: ZIP family metal transporter [Armatimonadota bacterium]|nr:ZIP family metal transporter [Armatimonadota bacterium]HPP75156.1 ZIP family metal transporter [Armatimonadota bacterium]
MSEATGLIVLRAAIAIIAAGVGGLIGISWKKSSHRTLCALVSFAAGALLAVTVVNIIPESTEMVGLLPGLAATFAGLIVFYLIGKYVYYLCPACAASASEANTGYLQLGVLLMVALAIHSAVDGLAIAASTHAHHEAVAVLVLLAVSYHKVPEGLALVSVSRLAGYTRWRAFGLTLLIELTTGLGAFIGLMVLNALTDFWQGMILGVVGGSFLYVVGFALIREMMEHERKSILGYLVIGFISIMALGLILQSFGIVHSH